MSNATETVNQNLRSKSIFWGLSIFGMAAVIALSAHFKFYLPWSPVPVTLQTMTVILGAALLGANRSALAILLIGSSSIAGFPVFTQTAALVGPTGGYILGFLLASIALGFLKEWRYLETNWFKTFGIFLLGNLAIFIPGILWLQIWLQVSLQEAFWVGFAPFIGIEVAKMALAATLYRAFARS